MLASSMLQLAFAKLVKFVAEPHGVGASGSRLNLPLIDDFSGSTWDEDAEFNRTGTDNRRRIE
jgi:hypothetical protein